MIHLVLSDKEIRDYATKVPPLIDGFSEESLQSESYDLTIGNIVSKYNSDFKILDLQNQTSIDEAYISIPIPAEGYLIGPKEYVLVSIGEKLNIPCNITAHIRPRTKFTRIGLIVSGQHCNSCYSGFLNLGLYNVNPFAVKIYAGMKLAQIVFEELKSTPSSEKQYRGSYQGEKGTVGADFTSEQALSELLTEKNREKFFQDETAKEVYDILIKGLE